jgi:hypothetical protein
MKYAFGISFELTHGQVTTEGRLFTFMGYPFFGKVKEAILVIANDRLCLVFTSDCRDCTSCVFYELAKAKNEQIFRVWSLPSDLDINAVLAMPKVSAFLVDNCYGSDALDLIATGALEHQEAYSMTIEPETISISITQMTVTIPDKSVSPFLWDSIIELCSPVE